MKLMHLFSLISLLFFMSCAEDSPTSNNDDTSKIKIGSTLISKLESEGVTLYKRIDTVIDIGTSSEAVPFMVHLSTDWSDQSQIFSRTSAKPMTLEQLRNFLNNEWDAFINGSEDEGVNGKEFQEFLQKNQLTLDMFNQLYQESQLSLPDFTKLIEKIVLEMGSFHPETGSMFEFFNFLIETKTDFSDLISAIKGDGMTTDGFFEKLKLKGVSFYDLLKIYYDEISDHDNPNLTELVEYIKNLTVIYKDGNESIQDKYSAFVEATKLAWQVIKDNAPISDVSGAVTRVLNPSDMNWSNYFGGESWDSKKYKFSVTDSWIKNYVLIEFYFHEDRLYKHKTIPGSYIANASIRVTTANVNWGYTVNANASCEHPVNIGNAELPIASIHTSFTIKCKNPFQSWSPTWGITYR